MLFSSNAYTVATAAPDAWLALERNQLVRDIADLEQELVNVEAEMAEFTRRYHERIGRRLARLDELRERLARAESERLCVRAGTTTGQWRAEQHDTRRFTSAATAAFRPHNDLKRRYRQIAQQIHPDRAIDETDRVWRTRLMSEVNRAYRQGDERALSEVVRQWQERRGATATLASAPAASALPRQVERLRARLSEIEGQLHRLFSSRLYALFISTRQAGRQGRDLLGEMAAQIDTSIAQLHRSCRTEAAT